MSSPDDIEATLLDRLDEHPLDESSADVLIGAILGEDTLAAALGGSHVERPARPDPTFNASTTPAAAYIKSVTVEGFRGIGPATKLELEPGPGLTIVCGRNGSGKSSFAEALEVLLTGDIRRFDDRPAVWRDSWRCLHVGEQSAVRAELLVEGVK